MSLQAAYNGMLSGHRNMFLLSTVAIAMIGFVKHYNAVYLQLAASFIFLLAAWIGVQASLDFRYYLQRQGHAQDAMDLRFAAPGTMNSWEGVGFTYATFLLILSVYVLFAR